MAKRDRPRNPVARAPILRKGGVHDKARSGERQRARQRLTREVRRRPPCRRAPLPYAVLPLLIG